MAKQTDIPAKYEPGFLKELDKRTQVYQLLNASYEAIIRDVGGDLSHTKLALIERFVFLEAVLQKLEIDIATKPDATADVVAKWVQAVNSMVGLARVIGLERVATPRLKLREYVARSEA